MIFISMNINLEIKPAIIMCLLIWTRKPEAENEEESTTESAG